MQKTVALLANEAELDAGVSCAQYMMYALRVIKSLELQVELPMLLKIENSGTVDLAKNWSVDGRTRNIEAQ